MLTVPYFLPVGIVEIDAQHRQLARLISAINSIADRQASQLNIVIAVSDLYDYLIEYFSEEEGRMLDSGYPGLDEHLKEHDKLKVRFRIVISTKCEDYKFGEMVSKLLKDWLVEHIRGPDAVYLYWLLHRPDNDAISRD